MSEAASARWQMVAYRGVRAQGSGTGFGAKGGSTLPLVGPPNGKPGGVGRSGSKPATKLASDLARRVAAEVSEAGWPVGRSLGSEDDLLKKYRVGRGILREAVRLLERDEVAVMKKGPAGGLVVTEPSVGATAYSLSIRLSRRGLGPSDVLETRKVLELAALDRIMDRFDDAAAEAISAQLLWERTLTPGSSNDDLQRFHRVLATLTGDPAMALFIDVMLRLTNDRWEEARREFEYDGLVGQIIRAHGIIGAALLAEDRLRARRAMERHLDAFRRWLR